jgi:Leucine-rich repeat (LRR) protein
MDDAELACRATQAEIARVLAKEEPELNLDHTCFHALRSLPKDTSGLKHVTRVDLGHTQIDGLAPLVSLPQITDLVLTETRISHLTDIVHLKSLKRLWLNTLPCTDFTPIVALDALEALSLTKTKIVDITPLSHLKALRTVLLDDTEVSHIVALAGLTHLEYLNLDRSKVTDLRPIAQLDFALSRDEAYFFKGLFFEDCAATRLDPHLERLSKIPADDTRTMETLAYLKNLK